MTSSTTRPIFGQLTARERLLDSAAEVLRRSGFAAATTGAWVGVSSNRRTEIQVKV
ncbi:MAG TPA: hypothetical protein VFI46_06020 [Jiangellaceae bacterium]|nr:hypothetical protein [Jiangellaceae bacterium]